MPYSAGRMLASKTAYSARNSAGRIYPSLHATAVASINAFPPISEGKFSAFKTVKKLVRRVTE